LIACGRPQLSVALRLAVLAWCTPTVTALSVVCTEQTAQVARRLLSVALVVCGMEPIHQLQVRQPQAIHL